MRTKSSIQRKIAFLKGLHDRWKDSEPPQSRTHTFRGSGAACSEDGLGSYKQHGKAVIHRHVSELNVTTV